MDAWDWDVRFEDDDTGAIPRHVLCDGCLIPRLPAQRQVAARRRYVQLREARERVGDAPRTLIGFEGFFTNAAGETFPAYFMAFPVEAWDPQLPQLVLAYGGEHHPEGPPLLVIFRAHLSTDWKHRMAWQITWSWWQPALEGTCELLNWRTGSMMRSEAERMMAALGGFREFSAPGPGRRRGTFKRSRQWYLDNLQTHAAAIRREPTEEEFCRRYHIDRKTLRRNLEPHGFWPWEEFLRRGLDSSQTRAIRA
jgi:hypothetical protein